MNDRAITFLRTLLDRDSDEGVALYEDFEDEAQAALTELEANAYIAPLVQPSLEAALLRCISIAFSGLGQHRQARRREIARSMFAVFHEDTGLAKEAMLAHIDKLPTSWRFPGRADMRAGVASVVV